MDKKEEIFKKNKLVVRSPSGKSQTFKSEDEMPSNLEMDKTMKEMMERWMGEIKKEIKAGNEETQNKIAEECEKNNSEIKKLKDNIRDIQEKWQNEKSQLISKIEELEYKFELQEREKKEE